MMTPFTRIRIQPLLLLSLLFLAFVPSARAAIVELTAEEFNAGIENNDYNLIIDVRTQQEWDEGHIEGVMFVENLAMGGNRHIPILGCQAGCSIALYCRSGNRARAAAAHLEANGFTGTLYNGQGVSQWTEAGFELVTTAESVEPACVTDGSFVCPCRNDDCEGRITRLTAEEFKAGMDNGDYDLVADVRTQAEWDTGHINGVMFVENLAQGGGREEAIVGCKDSCEIALYCQSGNRAGRAAVYLVEQGFSGKVYNGLGVGQWTAAGYPLVQTDESIEPECVTDGPAFRCPCRENCPIPAIICFASDMQVQVKSSDESLVKSMKDLKIGDEVLINDKGDYEPIYAFGHYDATLESSYLQFAPSGLQVSKDHMVFVVNKDASSVAIPASMVQVGDELASSGRVTSIRTISNQKGAYAPFTASGTILVNGVQASTFVSFQQSETLILGAFDTGLTYQWMARIFQLPHKWFGSGGSTTTTTTSSAQVGISSWVSAPHVFAQWWVKQNVVVMSLVAIPVITWLLVLATVEWMARHQLTIAFIVVVAALGARNLQLVVVDKKKKTA